nr:hypothetical protein [Tanacetum cinerariifolium]
MVADSLRWDERSRSSQVRALRMLGQSSLKSPILDAQEYIIVVGAENRPPMLDKKMYNSWQSCILLYLIGKENEHLTIQEIKLPFRMVELLFNKFKEDRVRVLLVWEPKEMLQVQEETMQLVKQGLLSVITAKVKRIWQGNTDNLDAYDSDCDDISSAKAVLMSNLLSYDSDVLSEVSQHDSSQNDDMINQSVQEMQNSEQSLIDYVPDTKITSDTNVISYEQYLQQM